MDNVKGQGKPQSLAVAAAANMSGYLRNASRRVRIPSAVGGRGTRRKLAMVTAATGSESPEHSAGKSTARVAVNVDDGEEDEWDEVDLPTASTAVVKKNEEKAKQEVNPPAVLKPDVAAAVFGGGSVKAEALQVEDGDCDYGVEEDPTARMMMEGTRPPLTGTPMQRWGRSDPAYERVLEQQQLLAAQRRSERIRAAAEGMSVLICALQRGKFIVQESRHPRLVRRLLRVKCSDGCGTGKIYPLLAAVQKAKEIYRCALDPASKRPVLSPCWVTVGKDTVKNHTSSSIMTLLGAINSVFSLDSSIDSTVFSDWTASVSPGYLFKMLAKPHLSNCTTGAKFLLLHSLYFSVILLSLATVTGMSCRLVMAMRKEQEQFTVEASNKNNEKQKGMSLFVNRTKRQRSEKLAEEDCMPKKLPSSCFWVEVWCPQRECFISVNPCMGCTTLWGAPYTFSIGGDVVVDATPRYITKYSTAFSYRFGRCDKYRFFWKHLAWDDSREASEVILDALRKDTTKFTREQLLRERKQLSFLTYSEEIPKTLTALQRHPLFVLESELARYEGVYPKDNTTIVGSVKGHVVYKRSAIVQLRSRDGWLRVGRCVLSEDEIPYKVVPPPASRPFASPSVFFGVWQTKIFEPYPLRSDGSLPLHGKTHWYVLLDKPVPAGLVHVKNPSIARVARRMSVDFGLAVVGFQRRRINERRFANWEVVIDGIVVRETDAGNLLRAYNDWRELTEEQEAAKRRQRSNRWWLHLTQRMLAMQRVRKQYLEGMTHGTMPLR